MNDYIIAPSVMCFSCWDQGKETLQELKRCGVGLLHTDVMDGHFVKNMMLGTAAVKDMRRACDVPLDLHMMVENPEDMLEWFDIQPGEYVSVHAESTRHLQRALAIVRERGGHPAVALNPATPLCMLEDVLCDCDMVLLMTVNPGFAGQKLVPQTLDKITRLRGMLEKAGRGNTLIEVDGNVSFENAIKMRAAGADVFVAGTSSIFAKGASIAENTAKLRAGIESVRY